MSKQLKNYQGSFGPYKEIKQFEAEKGTWFLLINDNLIITNNNQTSKNKCREHWLVLKKDFDCIPIAVSSAYFHLTDRYVCLCISCVFWMAPKEAG